MRIGSQIKKENKEVKGMKSEKQIRLMLLQRKAKIIDVKAGLYVLTTNELEKIRIEQGILKEILEEERR